MKYVLNKNHLFSRVIGCINALLVQVFLARATHHAQVYDELLQPVSKPISS